MCAHTTKLPKRIIEKRISRIVKKTRKTEEICRKPRKAEEICQKPRKAEEI